MGNPIRDIWAAGGSALNGWLAIPSGFSAEVLARAGWDSVTVDLQHGVQDYHSMVACFQGMQGTDVLPMVRVPWNEPGIIGKCLDAGARGVICPMVNSAEEARRFVAACRYPPEGARSNGPIRAGLTAPPGAYQRQANADILCLPMIETRAALDDLDAILATPGIDGVYVGPSDLGYSLGLPPMMDREETVILEAFERILTAIASRGLKAGLHTMSAAYARRAVGMGFRLVTIGSDTTHMFSAARMAVADFRRQEQAVTP